MHTKSAECRQKEKKAQCEDSAAFYKHLLCYPPNPTRIIFPTAFVKFNMISLNLHQYMLTEALDAIFDAILINTQK